MDTVELRLNLRRPNQQISHQVVVLDGLALLMSQILWDHLAGEGHPVGKLIKLFAFVGRGKDEFSQGHLVNLVQQERRSHGTPQFSKGEVEFVFSAMGAESPQDRRRGQFTHLNRQSYAQHIR